MFPFIVADIGGTNARFALVVGINDNKSKPDGVQDPYIIEHLTILQGADYPKFEDALQKYIELLDGRKITGACIAIAGPTEGEHITMTNLPWSFSKADVKRRFKFKRFEVINDFSAQALATTKLHDCSLASLVVGERRTNERKAIFGPGSGFGVAGLMPAGNLWLPIASEGGHSNVPIATSFEADVLKFMLVKHGYVSAEMCVSGPGIENLHEAVCGVRGVKHKKLRAADISTKAINGSCDECVTALNTFCSILGSMAANLVLIYGAKGGAYVTGGIVPRFVDFVRQSPFEQRYRQKGVMSKYVDGVPVDVVVHDKPALLGAAAWMYQLDQSS